MSVKRKINRIDYRAMFSQTVAEDHRIGDDVLLLDEFVLDPVTDYEFISAGNTFFEVLEGGGEISVNGALYPVEGHCLIVYFQGQIVRANISNGNTVQRAAVFSDRFMEELYHDSVKFSDIRSSILENPVIRLDDASSRRLELYVRTMREIAKDPDNVNGLVSARHETLSLFYGPLQKCFVTGGDTVSSRKPVVSSGFFSLLKLHFRTEHQLGFYSAQLNISDRYLYVCVKSTTGKTPSYWIDYYILLEAKKLLIENVLSINQISGRLGFAGPSQFGKFFKKHENRSAAAFRSNYSK